MENSELDTSADEPEGVEQLELILSESEVENVANINNNINNNNQNLDNTVLSADNSEDDRSEDEDDEELVL